MTKDELRTKTKELLEAQEKLISEKLESLLLSGALDLSVHEDNYALPRVVLCAIQESIISDMKPFSKQYKEEFTNIRHFV